MLENPLQVTEALKKFFPLSQLPSNPRPDRSPIQFCHFLIVEFCKAVTASCRDFSEIELTEALGLVEDYFDESRRMRFCQLYHFGEFTNQADMNNWKSFISSIWYNLTCFIKPGNFHFMKHLKGLHEEEKVEVLRCFRSLFLDRQYVLKVLGHTSVIMASQGGTYNDGCNDWSFKVSVSGVELECDGDGTFDESEIIRIPLMLIDFERALQLWVKDVLYA